MKDEVEAIASIAPPVPVGVVATVLGRTDDEIVTAVEELEADGRAESSRHGVTAWQTDLSPTRVANLASKLAQVLRERDATLLQVGRAELAAGEARAAYQTLTDAVADDTSTPQERFEAIKLAIEAGRDARIPTRDLAPMLVNRARLLRSRGETDAAVADLDAATPHLTGEALVDAYGFAAALHDDRQHPSDGERTIAMALLVAERHGLHAKLGSLLTFQGRLLARLGFDAETERVFERGMQLVNTHGTDLQRHYAALNQAWTDLDRGWVARAESRYSAARARTPDDDRVAQAELDIAIARAKFSSGDAAGASNLLDAADQVASETEAPALRFLATLARAEGAITFHRAADAVAAAEQLRVIVDHSFPAWRNRAATIEARAMLLAHRPADAREAIRRGFETTPRGANGLRLRTELEALAVMASERWDEEAAADIADRLLQGGWLLAAVAMLTERARKENRPELGRAAAALAHRIGAVPAAAEAIEVARAWDEPAAGPIALAVRRIAENVPDPWRESWTERESISHALAAQVTDDSADDTQLLAHLDQVLSDVGLGGADVILSPAQRRRAGLVTAGTRAMSMGRFIAWVGAAAIVAAVVAIALRPEPVEVPVTAPGTTAVTTTTIPPLLERIVEVSGELSGQMPYAGGEARNAVIDAAIGEPTGIYWRRPLTGFVRTEPVLRGRGLYLGDSEGWIYGLDVSLGGSAVFESQLQGAIDSSVTVEQVVFQQDDQGKTLVFAGDDRGNLLVRHVNDTEGEVFRTNLGAPITGPPLVRSESMIVATTDGVLHDLYPADGTEQRRFPAEGTVATGFTGPLAAADGIIYARTGEGAIVVIDEATFTVICTVFTPSARATTHVVVDSDRWYVGTSARTVRMFNLGDCSDAGNGTLQIDTPVNFAPVVADGVLWAVADAVLLPLDVASGQTAGFVVGAGGMMTAPPVIAGDSVLFATEAGDLVAVSRTDGTELWRVAFGSPIRTRPIVADGVIIVTTARGDVIALAAPTS
ncbi:MAG: PQQ-binding-like beta-propeller repeat protein [Acidimicrobiia bacterium]